MLLRNFFYAVGFMILITLHGLDADAAQFADLVRLVQSPRAFQITLTLTALLVGLEMILGIGSWRAGASSSGQASNGSTSSHQNPLPVNSTEKTPCAP